MSTDANASSKLGSHFPPDHDPRAGLPSEENQRIRYRIRFGKVGLLRWISHRDLAMLWERIARRTELPLSMTEGFHPKPRIAFPSALALGVESLDEVIEIELRQPMEPAELAQRLTDDRQPGLLIQNVMRVPENTRKAQLERTDYIITIPASADLDSARMAIESLLQKDTVCVERKKKMITADVATQIPLLELRPTDATTDLIANDAGYEHEQRLHLSLNSVDGAALKPGDVLELMGLEHWIPDGARITRTRVLLSEELPSVLESLAIANETI